MDRAVGKGNLERENGANTRHRRLTAAAVDPTGRRNPTKSIFAGTIPPTLRLHFNEILSLVQQQSSIYK